MLGLFFFPQELLAQDQPRNATVNGVSAGPRSYEVHIPRSKEASPEFDVIKGLTVNSAVARIVQWKKTHPKSEGWNAAPFLRLVMETKSEPTSNSPQEPQYEAWVFQLRDGVWVPQPAR